jgi:hypothetical protein
MLLHLPRLLRQVVDGVGQIIIAKSHEKINKTWFNIRKTRVKKNSEMARGQEGWGR